MSTIGFGMIGFGIGETRAQMIVDEPGAALVAVSDRDEGRRQAASAKFDVPVYEDYREMIGRADVDVVCIYTPAGVRRDIAVDAFAAGRHVLCTKPMEINIARCDDMIGAADAAGRELAIEFGNRYSPDTQAIKGAIDAGSFGRVLTADVAMKWFRGQDYYDAGGAWRGTYSMDGGGALANQTVHFIDQLLWFLGPPKRVMAHTATLSHDIEAEDLGVAMIEWECGAVSTLTGTTTTVPDFQYTRVDLHGERGGFLRIVPHTGYLPDPSRDPVGAYDQCRLTDAKGNTIATDMPDPPPAPKNVIEDVVSTLTTGSRPLVDGREGRKSIEILNGVYESARAGRAVEFPLDGPSIPLR